eukprot:TRINITY_DN4080_c0_g3_i1.p4 TRINITY_DN4080_c0_g3~~TRINITY_DN4080_c0_g3_i1.p4  ORF type:complete len:173 (+),score=2.95 TRINITY_DN4080_c0_g3_i1:234-752(+)
MYNMHNMYNMHTLTNKVLNHTNTHKNYIMHQIIRKKNFMEQFLSLSTKKIFSTLIAKNFLNHKQDLVVLIQILNLQRIVRRNFSYGNCHREIFMKNRRTQQLRTIYFKSRFYKNVLMQFFLQELPTEKTLVKLREKSQLRPRFFSDLQKSEIKKTRQRRTILVTEYKIQMYI